jgi:predicted RNA-binding Zn ribbon-like protein
MSHVPVLPAIPSVLLTEPLPLNLVNTELHLPDGCLDLLDPGAHRARWLTTEAERLGISADASAFGDETAAALKALREHVAAAIEPARHGKRPPAHALSGLNEALRAAPAVPQARWDGAAVTATTDRTGSLAARLAAGFAEAAVELLADPAIRKVRRCDAPACLVLFLARNPKRRWCTPSICGNRARVARYYQRHKAQAE